MRWASWRSCPQTATGGCWARPPRRRGTQQLVDDEVRRLIDSAHRDATDLLTAHRHQLDNLIAALLDAEALDGVDVYRAAGMPMRAQAASDAS
jgi:cell division protease FtsH